MTEQKRKKRNKAQAAQEVQEAAGDMPIKGKAATGAADPKEQEAAIMEEAARITGKPAADLTPEQAEAALFHEIGRTTPQPDPAGLWAMRQAKKDAQKNSRRAQEMTRGEPPAAAGELIEIAEGAQEVQKPTQEQQPAAEQEAQEDISSIKEIAGRMHALSFIMDYTKSPEDALLSYKLPGAMELYENWNNRHFARLVMRVAKELNADPAQIADKDRRTKEQQNALLQAAAREQIARFDAFMNSNYMQAMTALTPIKGKYPDPEPQDDYTLKELAALYFFALHFREIYPQDPQALTEEHIEELKAIFSRIDSYYYDRTNGGETERNAQLFFDFIQAENPDKASDIAAAMPLLQAIKPAKHTMPNNALMNKLTKDPVINVGAFDLPVINEKGRRKEITAYTMIDFDPGETSIKITDAKLTEYERQVSDAIISLWLEATAKNVRPIFNPDMIYRAMPGGSDKASPQQKGAITKAIEKFRKLHIYVDATEEMQKRRIIPAGKEYIFDEYYLNVRRHTVKTKNGGVIVQGYEILSQPVILTYCKLTNQLLTVSADLLIIRKIKQGRATTELVTMSATRQAMTGYLLRRIAVMKRDEKEARERKRSYDRRRAKDAALEPKPLEAFREQSPVVLFETLFNDAGIGEQKKQYAANNREFIFQVLDYWKASDYIKGYEKQKKGRSITGVKILI